MQYIPNLGEPPAEDARRDAVHVAVAPVVAAQTMHRGTHVALDKRGRGFLVGPKDPRAIGIVDPFRDEEVLPGARFWLFLYPNTVTSLRHVWTHPAFTPKIPGKEANDAV